MVDELGSDVFARSYPGAKARLNFAALDGLGGVALSGAVYDTLDLGGGVMKDAGNGTGFVAKLSSAGDFVWQRPLDFDLATVMAGATADVVVAAYFQGSLDFGLGPIVSRGGDDFVVVRYGPSGAPVRAVHYGGPGDEVAFIVTALPSAVPLLSGDFTDCVDWGNGPVTPIGSRDAVVVTLPGL